MMLHSALVSLLVFVLDVRDVRSQPSVDARANIGLLPFGKQVREAYFQFAPGTVYFNHGGYGATPQPVRLAMEAYTDRMEQQPTKWFGQSGYLDVIGQVREKLARVLKANASDLVFLDNASGGMNAVLRSLSWKPGDILFIIGSVYAVFPNTAAWLEQQYGLRTIHVDIAYPVEGPEDYLVPVRRALRNLTDGEKARVRMALLDHISSYPSVVLPVEDLAALVKEETSGSTLTFVDGAHALGQVHINVQKFQSAGVDFYVMDGHKWFMSPHGSGLLWVSPQVQAMLEPDVISSANGPGTPFQSKFDYIGTRDYGPWCTMGDTVDFRANELGGEGRIVTYLHDLAVWGQDLLVQYFGTESVAPANMTAGLMTIRLPIPDWWPLQAQRACSTNIGNTLADTYKMQVIPFALSTPNETHWIRVSAQVYLDKGDFKNLAINTLKIAKTCAPMLQADDIRV